MYIRDMRARWPLSQGTREFFQLRRGSIGDRLHPSVVEVPHPTDDPDPLTGSPG